MQGILCLILAATLALAAAVRQYRLRPQRAELDPPEQIGDYLLSRPAGWIDRNWAEGIVLEQPAAGGQVHRRIEIAQTRNAGFVSPLQYLVNCGELAVGELTDQLKVSANNPQGPFLQTIAIGPWPALLVRRPPVPPQYATRQPMKHGQLLACTILPSGHAIVLRFWTAGMVQPADEVLFLAVANSLRLDAQPEILAGPQLSLPDNIHLETPRSLATFATHDKLRVSRTLVDTAAPDWLAVDLVPCVVLAHDPAPELLAMLMLRDSAWGLETVRQIDESTWTCQRRPEEAFGAWAYLRINGDGRALLAEFRTAMPASAPVQARVEALWQQISPAIAFPNPSNVRERVKTGSAAVAQLPADPAALLDRPQTVQSWEWYSEDLPKTSTMTIQYGFNATDAWGMITTENGPPPGSSNQQHSQWRLNRDGGVYDHLLIRFGSARFSQECHLLNHRLQLTTRQIPGPVFQSVGEVPAAYLPGGILPLVLGRLPAQPMILHTETILAPHELPAIIPLRLLMEPAEDLPKHLPKHEQAMRCWSIRLNGASDSTRWYLDDAGQLHSITYPAGTHLHRLENETNAPARE
jgi:hypothetical protein